MDFDSLQQSQASCFPLITVFMLSLTNQLLAGALHLTDRYESGIDLLIYLSTFPKKMIPQNSLGITGQRLTSMCVTAKKRENNEKENKKKQWPFDQCNG